MCRFCFVLYCCVLCVLCVSVDVSRQLLFDCVKYCTDIYFFTFVDHLDILGFHWSLLLFTVGALGSTC